MNTSSCGGESAELLPRSEPMASPLEPSRFSRVQLAMQDITIFPSLTKEIIDQFDADTYHDLDQIGLLESRPLEAEVRIARLSKDVLWGTCPT